MAETSQKPCFRPNRWGRGKVDDVVRPEQVLAPRHGGAPGRLAGLPGEQRLLAVGGDVLDRPRGAVVGEQVGVDARAAVALEEAFQVWRSAWHSTGRDGAPAARRPSRSARSTSPSMRCRRACQKAASSPATGSSRSGSATAVASRGRSSRRPGRNASRPTSRVSSGVGGSAWTRARAASSRRHWSGDSPTSAPGRASSMGYRASANRSTTR
jgi:hypothetical protein